MMPKYVNNKECYINAIIQRKENHPKLKVHKRRTILQN